MSFSPLRLRILATRSFRKTLRRSSSSSSRVIVIKTFATSSVCFARIRGINTSGDELIKRFYRPSTRCLVSFTPPLQGPARVHVSFVCVIIPDRFPLVSVVFVRNIPPPYHSLCPVAISTIVLETRIDVHSVHHNIISSRTNVRPYSIPSRRLLYKNTSYPRIKTTRFILGGL